MIINSNRASKRRFFLISTLFFGLMLVFGLVGCDGSDNDEPPVTDEDASGLFTGTGIVNNGTDLTGIRGFVHDNRFIFFDETEAVLYDGVISSINESGLTATLDVYKDGAKVNTDPVSVTGMVISQSSISLSLNGADYASGTLSLTFDLIYNRGATNLKMEAGSADRWIGDSHTPNLSVIDIVSIRTVNDDIGVEFSGLTSAPTSCNYEYGFKEIPDPTINIYRITSLDVTDPFVCDHAGTGYTGFFAVVDGTGTDDTLLFAATNGVNSNFSIMTKP